MSVATLTRPTSQGPLAAFLRQRREELDLKPYHIAARGGCSPALIDAYERGRIARPSVASLKRVAAGLECDVQTLINLVLSQQT